MIIQNPTPFEQVIPGFPSFAPHEERKVSKTEAAILLNGTPLRAVSTPDTKPEKAKKGSTKSSNASS